MKNYMIIQICLLIMGFTQLSAQENRMITSGSIAYERSNNMYALIKREIGENDVSKLRFEEYKKRFPQFKKSYSILAFSERESLFTPLKDHSVSDNYFDLNPVAMQHNITYVDYTANLQVTQKQMFEEIFLVKDTLAAIKWKLMDEFREIAGFNCRRANGILMDSIYVVAFYTDQIPISGGPESFGGLPGMILGIALPHENVTWFAQKVTDENAGKLDLNPPTKGKATDRNGLRKIIAAIFKGFERNENRSIWAFEL